MITHTNITNPLAYASRIFLARKLVASVIKNSGVGEAPNYEWIARSFRRLFLCTIVLSSFPREEIIRLAGTLHYSIYF